MKNPYTNQKTTTIIKIIITIIGLTVIGIMINEKFKGNEVISYRYHKVDRCL